MPVETSPRRAIYLKLPGNCAQKAGSSAISSRTVLMPRSAKRRLRLGDAFVDLGRRVAADRDRHMMLAEAGAAGGDLVLGAGEVGAQAHRLVLGRAHAAEREVHPPQRRLPLDEAEALRDGQLEGQAKQLVEHARRGLPGIILDRDEAEEAALLVGAGAELDRLLAEADPAIGEVGAEILHRHQHRAHLAIVERGEEFERLRAEALRRFVGAEHARPIAAERGEQRVAGHVELAHLVGGAGLGLDRAAAEQATEPVEVPTRPWSGRRISVRNRSLM